MASRRRFGPLLAMWICLFTVAFAVDLPVARLVDRYEPIGRKKPLGVRVLKQAGDFKFVSIAIVVAAVVHRSRWRAGVVLLGSCALSGAFYGTKWIVGRHRPSFALEPFTFHPFKDGLPGIVYAQKLSFPSGHACLVFAAASCLRALFPRWGWAFYSIAIMLGVERVLEGAHYPSDIVAGAAFGMLSTAIMLRAADGWFRAGWLNARSRPSDAGGFLETPSRLRLPLE